MNVKKTINRKLYFLLLVASGLSIVAIMPYILTLQGDMLRAAPMPLPIVILVSIIQSIILFAIFIFIGLKLSKKLWLGMPLIERLVNKEKIDVDVKVIIKTSVIIWCLAGAIIAWLDFLFNKLGASISLSQVSVPIWQGFLASFYGWISEEIVMRLFFMTLIIWIISKFTRSKDKIIENNWIIWISIIIATILFGIGHLPITASLTTITPLVVIRALLLNGIGWIVFGWLYWKKGLESAIIAHFSADIIIQVVLPLTLLLNI